MKQAWKKVGEELVYNGWRKIVRKDFEVDGKKMSFDVKQEADTVCMLGITPENKVVVIRQFRPGPEDFTVELPGGGVEAGEDILEAAKREFIEESGYDGDFEETGPSIYCPYSIRTKHNFIVTNCRKVQAPSGDDGDHIEVFEMPMEEFKAYAVSGRLPESDTAIMGLVKLGEINL